MGRFVDLTGQRFGRLTVIERCGTGSGGSAVWRCICDCGNETTVISPSLRQGLTRSCGCLSAELTSERGRKHGGVGTRLYHVWDGMIQRCHNPNRNGFHNYGGRGISVCDEWRNSFETFRTWALAAGYDETAPRGVCTLDRIDLDGPYCPENCRWISHAEQQLHKRDNHVVTFNGKTMTLAEWSVEVGIPRGILYGRINQSGWSEEAALTTPVKTTNPLTYAGKTQSLTQWAREYGLSLTTLQGRLARGWPMEKALTTPPRKHPLSD